jgi:hypothetical protein
LAYFPSLPIDRRARVFHFLLENLILVIYMVDFPFPIALLAFRTLERELLADGFEDSCINFRVVLEQLGFFSNDNFYSMHQLTQDFSHSMSLRLALIIQETDRNPRALKILVDVREWVGQVPILRGIPWKMKKR